MSTFGQSTIWGILSAPSSPVGSVPFVSSDSVTVISDVLNLYYSAAGLSTYSGSQQPYQLTVFGGLRQGYSDITNTPGVAGTINKPSGRFILASGNSVFTLTNSYCFGNPQSIVNITPETIDAHATRYSAVSTTGSFTLTLNAICSGAMTFSFDIRNVF